MHITNAQIKSLLDTYNMIILARDNTIAINDICNHGIIKRYEKVLNDLLQDRINENNANNELFIKARKVIKHNGKLQ